MKYFRCIIRTIYWDLPAGSHEGEDSACGSGLIYKVVYSFMCFATHPQAGAVAFMLNKQELIDAKVLVPILRNELEESGSREGRRVTLRLS
jgi:hypothetical protein